MYIHVWLTTLANLYYRHATFGDMHGAILVLDLMQTKGHLPDEATFNSLLKLCVRNKDANLAVKVRLLCVNAFLR